MTHAARSRLRRRVAVEQGMCARCFRRRVPKNTRQCEHCRKVENDKRRARMNEGFCCRCLKRPKIDGTATCRICTEYLHSREKDGARSRRRSQYVSNVTRAARAYVKALRKLEMILPSEVRSGDRPEEVFAARQRVQAAVKDLFSTVERKAC